MGIPKLRAQLVELPDPRGMPPAPVKAPVPAILRTKVSHDQYFLSQVATEFWSVANGKLTATRQNGGVQP